MGIHFITLRRREKNLLEALDQVPQNRWEKLHIDIPKKKYKNPIAFDSTTKLTGYDDELRQIVLKGTVRENPSFLITNNFQSPAHSLVFRYAKRWRIENGIAEAVKFFSLNALSSPVLIKVHFDVLMTMIAYAFYHFLSQKPRGFEHCRSSTISRKFIDMKVDILIEGNDIIVEFPRRSHNPIIKAAQLDQTPSPISWLINRRVVY